MKTLTIASSWIALAAFALASAIAPAAHAQSAAAPTMNVGDRWVYNVKSGIGLSTITYQETREVNYFFHTRGWDKQTVPAGAFDAIRVDVLMVLDDSTPFRNATNCNFTYWYSPAVRGTVRERRTAQYTQLDQHAEYRVLDAFYELASFTPAKP